MDKSITKSPFSTGSRLNISGKRTLLPQAFRKSSRFGTSGKSTQSIQIILKTPYNFVERFGHPLPVLITEALTFAERNVVVTARISECGYAWVVCGRRLLIWQYRQCSIPLGVSQRRQTISNQCFELQLPQSDLAHRAELVSVFVPSSSSTPSCIAVSPEGLVRYWPSVTHEGLSVEQTIDLQGQECDSLTDIGGLGCILATTTCSVVLVQPQLSGGRNSLLCHSLHTPSGWLSGLSKRMSSLIFGPISAEQTAETRLVRVLTVAEHDNTWIVYVLAGHSLQKWKMSMTEPEELIFVAELNRFVRDGFHATVWENCGGDQTETDTWLLDIQSDKDNVIILAAAVNMHVSPQVHYALISVQTNTNHAPTNIKDFLILKMSGLYREDNPAESLFYRFLLSGTTAYVYNQRSITVIKPQEEPDVLEFNVPQDFLLGGSICVNTPVFFSRSYGLVAVSNNDMGLDINASIISSGTPLEVSSNESIAGNLTLYSIDPDEMYSAYKDTENQLKAAFVFHVKNQVSACHEILGQLFSSQAVTVPSVDAVLDKTVATVCQELLNDVPAGDPRWDQSTPAGLGSSSCMQILSQLEDKQLAYGLFMRFLKETELLNKLAAITVRDTIMYTIHVLGELSEKLVAAIALKKSVNSKILESAIDQAVSDVKNDYEDGLSNQDVFYREVTKVYRVLQELVNTCEEVVHSDRNPPQVAMYIYETNELLLAVLKDVMQHRQQTAKHFVSSPIASSLAADYLPWTAASGPEGLYDTIMLQQSLTYNYGAKLTSDDNLSNMLNDQLVCLIDIILDGRKCHLESIKGTDREDILYKQYQSDRNKVINPFITVGEYERAAVLAEKYLDFESLVAICAHTNNDQRLYEYMDRFSVEGFPEYACTWYMQQNKNGKLIDLCRKTVNTKNAAKLTGFLAQHPTLSWIHNMFDKKFDTAAETLKKLAFEETESVTRQKTMFSLSKLAKLAAPNVGEVDEEIGVINSYLELITFQEELPDYVLQHYGYDTARPRVIPAKDLINLYICNEYKEATEVEYKKALDLLMFIDDIELRSELMLKVWRNTILRDSWSEVNLDNPLEVLQCTLFYRLINVALTLGSDPQTLLPPLEVVMDDPGLVNFHDNKTFQYLIKTGYEQVSRRIQSDS